MVGGLEALGALSAAVQLAGTIYSIGIRILDEKPNDRKSIRQLVVDARSYITQLARSETTVTGDARAACRELHRQLDIIIDDIDGLGRRKTSERAKTWLKLWKPEFRERFADALETFKFRMCLENHSSKREMIEELGRMTERMKELRIASKTLETLPRMEDGVAELEKHIQDLSQQISSLTRGIENIEGLLSRMDSRSVAKPQLEAVVRTDGELTRASIRQSTENVVMEVDKVLKRQLHNETLIKIDAEILPKSNDLVWYGQPDFRIWSLDSGTAMETGGNLPQANYGGLDLRTVPVDPTYTELNTDRYQADEFADEIRARKRQRTNDASPYVGLARRGDYIEELRDFIPSWLEERLCNELTQDALREALRIARSAGQETRYAILFKILEQKAHTLPKMRLLESLERAMLILNAGKVQARLGFFTQHTVEQVDFPYRLLLDITR